ncbi:hypothetical protein PG996_015492 [Apiospora saccharicola]|uniref:Uncharacterized protein n=1 Tax=Apiospora saccharicola TaxID=335842 RepID=A0ABR1TL99_9PEZI
MENANKQAHPWVWISDFVPRGTGLGVIHCVEKYERIRYYLEKEHRVAIIGYTTDMSQYVFLVSEETEGTCKAPEGCNVFVYYNGARQEDPRFIALWEYQDPYIATRLYEFVSIAKHCGPWALCHTLFPTDNSTEVTNCMAGYSLPKVMQDITCDLKRRGQSMSDATVGERELQPEITLPQFCQSPRQQSQLSHIGSADPNPKGTLDSGIVFFDSYNLPDNVMKNLDEVAKSLAPRELLAPRGLLKLAVLNWWHTFSKSDGRSGWSLHSYLIYFVVMVFRVLRSGAATFPSVSEFQRACSRVDKLLWRNSWLREPPKAKEMKNEVLAALNQLKPAALGPLFPHDMPCFGQHDFKHTHPRDEVQDLAVKATVQMLGDLRGYAFVTYTLPNTFKVEEVGCSGSTGLKCKTLVHTKHSPFVEQMTLDEASAKLETKLSDSSSIPFINPEVEDNGSETILILPYQCEGDWLVGTKALRKDESVIFKPVANADAHEADGNGANAKETDHKYVAVDEAAEEVHAAKNAVHEAKETAARSTAKTIKAEQTVQANITVVDVLEGEVKALEEAIIQLTNDVRKLNADKEGVEKAQKEARQKFDTSCAADSSTWTILEKLDVKSAAASIRMITDELERISTELIIKEQEKAIKETKLAQQTADLINADKELENSKRDLENSNRNNRKYIAVVSKNWKELWKAKAALKETMAALEKRQSEVANLRSTTAFERGAKQKHDKRAGEEQSGGSAKRRRIENGNELNEDMSDNGISDDEMYDDAVSDNGEPHRLFRPQKLSDLEMFVDKLFKTGIITMGVEARLDDNGKLFLPMGMTRERAMLIKGRLSSRGARDCPGRQESTPMI